MDFLKFEYWVDDISTLHKEGFIVEANTVSEAVKKAFPDLELERDYENKGHIVLGHYVFVEGKGYTYRKYVYKQKGQVF